MSRNDQTYTYPPRKSASGSGPIIDQDGREIAPGSVRPNAHDPFTRDPFARDSFAQNLREMGFDFSQSSANPFAKLSREQRLARLETLARLLDVAFVVPGTNIRYGIDGLIGLIPVVGDVLTTAISLWIVREARALGAPRHLIARMLGNVARLVVKAGNQVDPPFALIRIGRHRPALELLAAAGGQHRGALRLDSRPELVVLFSHGPSS